LKTGYANIVAKNRTSSEQFLNTSITTFDNARKNASIKFVANSIEIPYYACANFYLAFGTLC